MSATVDERIVSMQFDNKQFESNVQTSLGTIDRLKRSLNFDGASRGLDNVNAAAKGVNFNPLSSAVETLRFKFSALEVMAVTALANITNSAVNAGKRIVSALTIEPVRTGLAEYETQIGAIQTILANTKSKGTTLDDVNGALDELNSYADKTIYNFTEMTRNIGTFTAAGVGLDESVSAIKGIANLAAISGSTSQQASTAMYQLSQALASGTVKLQDWNSVVNAGMGGEVFQTALKRTAKQMGHDVDGMIEKYGSFRESLTRGEWLTTEVLTETLAQLSGAYTEADLIAQGYTEAQAKEIVELAKTAESAATDVKTFTQLIDTTKESLQSGWTRTWEILIGDFEEAKALWSTISEELGSIIGASSERRNSLLSGALSESTWGEFAKKMDEAGGSVEAYEKAVRETYKEHGGNLDEVITKYGSFEAAVKAGAISTNILTESLSDVEGITSENIKSLTKLVSGFDNLGGRKLLLESFANVWKALKSIVAPVKEAFEEIFPPMTAKRLYDLIDGFHKFTSKLKLSEEAAGKIKTAFKGIFSAIDVALTFVKELAGGILRLLGNFTGLGDVILNASGSIGEWLINIRESVKEGDLFGRAIDKIVGFLQNGIEKIKEFFAAVGEKFSTPGWDIFGKMLSGIWHIIKIVGGAIVKVGSAIGSIFTSGGFSEAISMLNGGLFAGLILQVTKFFKGITGNVEEGFGLFESIKNTLSGVVEVLDGVKDALKTWQQDLKANIIQKIAIAIGILAVSLVVLASIDPGRLATALTAITGLFIALMTSLKSFSKSGISDMRGVGKAVTAMMGISVAVLILASALKKLSDLSWGGLAKGLIGVAGLMAIVVIAAKNMSTFVRGKHVMKGATQMVILAAAVKILASACKDLSALSWEEMAKGLIAVGILMAEVAAFTKFAKLDGRTMSTAIGIAILAGAVKILASVCADLSAMSWGEIGKGLAAIGGLLLELAIFTKIASNSKMMSSGVGLIAVSAALLILVDVLNSLGGMSWESIAKGLAAIGGSLIILAIALNTMTGTMGGSAALIGASLALSMLAPILIELSGMSWESIAKGLVAIGGSLTILAVALNVMTGTLAGSAALLVASLALAVLTPVLKSLGGMSWGSIVKGLVTIAGAFAILGVAGLVLGPMIPVLLGLAGALALLGVGMMGIGVGVFALGAGIASLAASLAVGATAIASGIATIIMEIASLIPNIMKEIGRGIVELCKAIGNSAVAIAGAIKDVLLACIDMLVECVPALVEGLLVLIEELLKGLAAHTPAIVESAVNIIFGILEGIANAVRNFDPSVFVDALVGIGMIAAVLAALTAIALLIPGAMIGVLGLGLLVSEVALVLSAIGALAQMPGLQLLIDESGGLLKSIGNAIGDFVGGFLGGVAEAVASSLPNIGTDLSEFMINAKPFFDGIATINPSAVDSVKTIADIILTLTAANIIDGISSWIAGGSSLERFGEQLPIFGAGIKGFSDAVLGVNTEAVSAAATAAETIMNAASKIPNSGGIISWIVGDNEIDTFGEQLPIFGAGIKGFSDAVVGINPEAVTAAATAAGTIMTTASKIPNSGGIISWFVGDNDIGDFGKQLSAFGEGIKSFSDNVKGVSPDAVTAAANAANVILSSASTLPNSGGIVSWFTGDNDLSSFGGQLKKFGKGLKDFSDSVVGVDTVAVTAAASAASTLITAASKIPVTGGLAGLLVGDNDMSSFGGQLKKFGTAIKDFSKEVVGVNWSSVSVASAQLGSLSSVLASMPSDFAGAGSFAMTLKNISKTSIDDFVSAFTNASTDVAKAVKTLLDSAVSSVELNKPKVTNAMGKIPTDSVTAIKNARSDFAAAGKHLVEGFANGISTNTYLAVATASAMATAARIAAEMALGIKSPSRVFYKIGEFSVAGFANALGDGVSTIYDAGRAMADSARGGLSSAISKVQSLIENGIDSQPTIRPVMDLSDIVAGTSAMNGMLDMQSSVGVMANIGAISSMMSGRQNGANDDIISAIRDLGRSMGNSSGDTYNFDSITYDDGSNVSSAVRDLIHAVKMERRT